MEDTAILTDCQPHLEIVGSYENLDGVTVQVTRWMQEHIDHFVKDFYGYTKEIKLRGPAGPTGLMVHMKKSYVVGIVAFVKPDEENPYIAYVILEDGTITSGCFCQFSNGTWNIS